MTPTKHTFTLLALTTWLGCLQGCPSSEGSGAAGAGTGTAADGGTAAAGAGASGAGALAVSAYAGASPDQVVPSWLKPCDLGQGPMHSCGTIDGAKQCFDEPEVAGVIDIECDGKGAKSTPGPCTTTGVQGACVFRSYLGGEEEADWVELYYDLTLAKNSQLKDDVQKCCLSTDRVPGDEPLAAECIALLKCQCGGVDPQPSESDFCTMLRSNIQTARDADGTNGTRSVCTAVVNALPTAAQAACK